LDRKIESVTRFSYLTSRSKYSPEFGSSQGMVACDEQINDPTVANQRAERKEMERSSRIVLEDGSSF